jgi:hypothetical protein
MIHECKLIAEIESSLCHANEMKNPLTKRGQGIGLFNLTLSDISAEIWSFVII